MFQMMVTGAKRVSPNKKHGCGRENNEEKQEEGKKSGRMGKGEAEREHGSIHGHANRGARPSKSGLRHGMGDVQVNVRRKGSIILRREGGMGRAERNYQTIGATRR